MFRIDQPTAALTLPAPAAAGTPGYFQGGNSGTGTAATVVSADWLNGVQEELMSILTAASIGENKTAFNQVLTALQALFAPILGFGGSVAEPGWIQLFRGLILQWGGTTVPASSPTPTTTAVTLPTAFPNACLAPFVCFGGTNPPGGGAISASALSKSQINITASSTQTNLAVNFIAFGN